jgi:hypothetical protein
MKYADGYGKHGWSLVSLPLGAFIFILGPSLSLASRFHPLAAKSWVGPGRAASKPQFQIHWKMKR